MISFCWILRKLTFLKKKLFNIRISWKPVLRLLLDLYRRSKEEDRESWEHWEQFILQREKEEETKETGIQSRLLILMLIKLNSSKDSKWLLFKMLWELIWQEKELKLQGINSLSFSEWSRRNLIIKTLSRNFTKLIRSENSSEKYKDNRKKLIKIL